ncbi:MAG: methyltransferase domain-containing protein [Candidatus Shapirobacteria bacterium]
MIEKLSNGMIPNQMDLWDKQHMHRGRVGPEATSLRDVPNDTAILFTNYLSVNPSNILEIGCANGRDARYWASLGHTIFCVDFSQVALDQLDSIAQEQGVRDLLRPILHDINTGKLPETGDCPLHGFYSRSALHINDEKMISIAKEIDKKIVSRGVILIEGKGNDDHKIKRGVPLDQNLIIDHFENGHIRRVWTKSFILNMCDMFNWQIKSLEEKNESSGGNLTKFVRLIAYKS